MKHSNLFSLNMVYVHIAQPDVIKGCTNMFVRGDETFQMEKILLSQHHNNNSVVLCHASGSCTTCQTPTPI